MDPRVDPAKPVSEKATARRALRSAHAGGHWIVICNRPVPWAIVNGEQFTEAAPRGTESPTERVRIVASQESARRRLSPAASGSRLLSHATPQIALGQDAVAADSGEIPQSSFFSTRGLRAAAAAAGVTRPALRAASPLPVADGATTQRFGR